MITAIMICLGAGVVALLGGYAMCHRKPDIDHYNPGDGWSV